jgi:nicotinamide riboside transporter PnuC
MIDFIGHISYLFLTIGIYLLSKHNKLGWIFSSVCQLGWIFIGFWINMTSLWTWAMLFLLMNLYGYFKWSENENKI